MGTISSDLLKRPLQQLAACISFHKQHVLQHFCSGMHRNQKFPDFWTRKWPTSLGFLRFKFFLCAFPFCPFLIFLLQLLTFYWACFQLKKILRKHHQYRQILPWSGHVWLQAILLWVFQSNFLTFSCIFQAPLSQSLWSGCHWKDVFLLQNLNTGQRSSWLVTAGMGVKGFSRVHHL